jgi:glycosyltransferase involved in cell wall biosynthesis
MRKPNVYLLTPSLMPYDAIGNDVLGMAAALRSAGYQVEVFAEEIDKSCADAGAALDLHDRRRWHDSHSILIYHHSMAWPKGEALLQTVAAKLVVRYHNITPARFFSRYSEAHYRACKDGDASTRRLARISKAWFLGASSYNCEELVRLGAPIVRTRALAPFHTTEELSRVPFDAATLDRYKDGSANILFVGGLKPNKGHLRALGVLAEYRRWSNPDARLIFAGMEDPRLASYKEELAREAESMRLARHVVFAGRVSASQLRSLYTLADVFLSVSEHEGFCVPLVESMFFRLPIVAWSTTAVGETIGKAGLVWNDFDIGCLAESIQTVVENGDLARHLSSAGFQRFQREFRPDVVGTQLESVLERVSRGEAIA